MRTATLITEPLRSRTAACYDAFLYVEGYNIFYRNIFQPSAVEAICRYFLCETKRVKTLRFHATSGHSAVRCFNQSRRPYVWEWWAMSESCPWWTPSITTGYTHAQNQPKEKSKKLTSYETEKNRKNQRPNRQNQLTTKREHLVLIRKYSPRSIDTFDWILYTQQQQQHRNQNECISHGAHGRKGNNKRIINLVRNLLITVICKGE